MSSIIRPALVLFAGLTLLCCVAYPLAVTGLAQTLFPQQAQGSIVERNGQPVGSVLIGQAFSSPKYFWGRPSATSPMPNQATASSASNLGPLNPALMAAVKSRLNALKRADPDQRLAVPVDLVTASGSGLDPELSVAATLYQVARVARLRGISAQHLHALINLHTEPQYFGFFGEPRVNILALNLALDAESRHTR